MKRKYYMRGLGFGILITTLVFSFLNSGKPTDEEVIKRAEELGYVLPEASSTPGIDLEGLKDKNTPAPSKVPEEKVTPEPTATGTPIPTATVAPTLTPVTTDAPTEPPKETVMPTPTVTPEPTATNTPIPTEIPEPTPQVVKAQIVIVKGNTASKVCRMIEEAGIVADWEELRDYLRSRDLINEINVGTFTLSSDMDMEEIAKIITGK